MDDLLFARGQMALSLAFHIVFAAIGMAMPLLMVIAEVRWRRSGHPDDLALAKAWAKGTAVLFAVGAVSGTVLAFELGLLFPGFMRHAGAIIGLPFSLEGFAFFTEAIFLGLYLYGWDRVAPRVHIFAGVVVTVSGLASAVFVTIANAWMNAPVGFRFADGEFSNIDPIAAMQSPFVLHEVLHMAVAAYLATALAAAGVHAWALRRRPDSSFHRRALGIALAVVVPTALAQPVIGHFAGQRVAVHQPMKLAAMEGLVETTARAPLRIGPIEIPGGLSFLAFGDTNAVVKGLAEIPRADWPPGVVRIAWQLMVLIGTALAGLAMWVAARFVRRRATWTASRLFLGALVLASPLGFVATEAGWVVTEVGRQPWIVYGIMRTSDAVTPMPGLVTPFVVFTLIYIGLAAAVVFVLRRQFRATVA
ncbi:MAG: cytochrome ubiquinol oxidase subunit I [Deltaproteobacteria bacterium]|nr:cytochrome ubiquinol oxidase subunit I [Deltaproteobacteria bacterium]